MRPCRSKRYSSWFLCQTLAPKTVKLLDQGDSIYEELNNYPTPDAGLKLKVELSGTGLTANGLELAKAPS